MACLAQFLSVSQITHSREGQLLHHAAASWKVHTLRDQGLLRITGVSLEEVLPDQSNLQRGQQTLL